MPKARDRAYRLMPKVSSPAPEPDFRDAVARLLGVAPGALAFAPLAGGVSSDIWQVRCEGRSYCAKRALPRLKTSARWEAPVSRNAEEVRWLRTARQWVGESVAEVIAADDVAGIAILAWYDPSRWRCWKTELLAGRVDIRCAVRLGEVLGTTVRCAAAQPELAGEFANAALFDALRVDPFFRHMRTRHPAIAPVIETFASDQRTLVHGDFSPKNFLVDAAGGVRILDAECATWGSPGFDAGYLLAHLLLKRIHVGQPELLTAAAAFWDRYARTLDGRFDDLDRVALLALAGVLLARVDGKSPVEYLTGVEQQLVRGIALRLLDNPPATVSALLSNWPDDWRNASAGSTVHPHENDRGSSST
jgi:hypothetical protein